ncbi:hypothetical protein B0H14DRAFT_3137145 [Mycena olivaceomarginata]|nr:hypothetical protein B0H14DRAFT_3137145 [Mycena olivaceomarginata]
MELELLDTGFEPTQGRMKEDASKTQAPLDTCASTLTIVHVLAVQDVPHPPQSRKSGPEGGGSLPPRTYPVRVRTACDTNNRQIRRLDWLGQIAYFSRLHSVSTTSLAPGTHPARRCTHPDRRPSSLVQSMRGKNRRSNAHAPRTNPTAGGPAPRTGGRRGCRKEGRVVRNGERKGHTRQSRARLLSARARTFQRKRRDPSPRGRGFFVLEVEAAAGEDEAKAEVKRCSGRWFGFVDMCSSASISELTASSSLALSSCVVVGVGVGIVSLTILASLLLRLPHRPLHPRLHVFLLDTPCPFRADPVPDSAPSG